mgnify:CR=1 FL=1
MEFIVGTLSLGTGDAIWTTTVNLQHIGMTYWCLQQRRARLFGALFGAGSTLLASSVSSSASSQLLDILRRSNYSILQTTYSLLWRMTQAWWRACVGVASAVGQSIAEESADDRHAAVVRRMAELKSQEKAIKQEARERSKKLQPTDPQYKDKKKVIRAECNEKCGKIQQQCDELTPAPSCQNV